MKKLSAAFFAFLAAPFGIVVAAMGLDSALHILFWQAVAVGSILLSWCGTEFLGTRLTPNYKVALAFSLAAGPWVLLSRSFLPWYPGGVEALILTSFLFGVMAPTMWPYVKSAAVTEIVRYGWAKVVKRKDGTFDIRPTAQPSGADEKTQILGIGAPTELPDTTVPKEGTTVPKMKPEPSNE